MSRNPEKRYDKIVACARCGTMRKVTRPNIVLCRDCRYVLPAAERALWNAA